jgi:hypothetical protein
VCRGTGIGAPSEEVAGGGCLLKANLSLRLIPLSDTPGNITTGSIPGPQQQHSNDNRKNKNNNSNNTINTESSQKLLSHSRRGER